MTPPARAPPALCPEACWLGDCSDAATFVVFRFRPFVVVDIHFLLPRFFAQSGVPFQVLGRGLVRPTEQQDGGGSEEDPGERREQASPYNINTARRFMVHCFGLA